MGKESKSRRKRTQERQDRGTLTKSASAATSIRETGPDQLLAKYEVEPIPDLPGAVKKFHLRIVTDILEGHDNCAESVGALRATQTWHRHHDGFAASRPSELNFGGTPRRLACTPGCNHCCRSPVGVVAAEALLIADFVDRTFSAHERQALKGRMEARKAALQNGDPLRTYSLCPLNAGGQCLVYEFRPHNCRVFHSFDVDACEGFFVAGETQRGLPIDPVRKQYDRLIAASATVAFHALKLDMRMLEFMAALEIALEAGDDRCERFAAGADLFSGLPTIARPSSPAASTPE
ncbi:MAG: hypothetical protein H0T76_12225 [Nannocystis sp.]|nr:hypothetical protein [Nannocystis sp.]MBA3547244.1 hypothetical protein [Nannocystis sp.]